MTKNIFLFPGQGAQVPGMALDVCEVSPAARSVMERMSAILGYDVAALIKDSTPEDLARSDKSQVAITAAELALCAALREKGIEPTAVAGFSLGEYPALCVSGILGFEDTVRLVAERGRVMQAVCDEIAARGEDGSKPGMAAVVGLSPEQVIDMLAPYADIARSDAVFAANRNSPKQTVVSGTAEGLKVCEQLAKDAGARRFIPLKVAGPFHSPLMAKAAELFKTPLDAVTFQDPAVPCFSNVSGERFASAAEARESVPRHMVEAVRWTDEEAAMVRFMDEDGTGATLTEPVEVCGAELSKSCGAVSEAGTTGAGGSKSGAVAGSADASPVHWRVIEVGPGKTLSGLWRDSGFAEKAVSALCGTAEQLAAIEN